MSPSRALVVDHRDSFVFNLVDDLERAGVRSTVIRAEGFHENALAEHDADLVVLSPGPGHPDQAKNTTAFLAREKPIPVLGICLGMQAMVTALGGRVAPQPRGPVHGRADLIAHEGDPLFSDTTGPIAAARYHSLRAETLPAALTPIAWTTDRETVMAVRHQTRPWLGLQFHPESILTPTGPTLIRRYLESLR